MITRLNKLSIHDPALDWVPPPERGSSGRSTPSSTTLVGGNYNKPVQNGTVAGAPEPSTAQRSSSSQSAHCWGYIQGLCPHSGDTCKFIHPSNIVPCTSSPPLSSTLPAALLLSQKKKKNRYEVHTVPDVAALRVPESSMPPEAPAGGQALDARTARRGSRDGAPRGPAAAATDGSTVCRRAAPPPCVPRRVAAGRASLAHYPARRSVRERCTVPQPDTTFSGDVQPAAAARGCALEPPFGRGSRFGRS